MIDVEEYIIDRSMKFSSEEYITNEEQKGSCNETDNRKIAPCIVEVASANDSSRTKCLYLPFYVALLNLLGDALVSHSDEEGLDIGELV
jgi:hypothetical protein